MHNHFNALFKFKDNIMKRIVGWLFLLLVSCSDENEPAFFNVSNTSIEYDWKGGKQNIYVESNSTWNITSISPSWLNVEVYDNNVVFDVEPNETTNSRSSNVIFSASGIVDTVFVSQKAKERLAFTGGKYVVLEFSDTSFSIDIDKNVNFEIKYLDNTADWISQGQNSNVDSSLNIDGINGLWGNNKLTFVVKENASLDSRKGQIVIYNDYYQLSDTLNIEQKGGISDYYRDGEYIVLQKVLSKSANLIVMGDGFGRRNLQKGGKYVSCLTKAVDYFFSIEPYKSYQDYFNVYMVVAESEEEGVGEKNLFGQSTINNKFSTAFGDGTEIVCNDELIFEYARKVKELPADKPITVLVVLNSTKYAGTAYLYADGNSIALCPISTEASPNDFEGIVHHEAGGHAFGFLCDEYVYYDSKIPENRKDGIREWQKLGYQMNLDFTDNLEEILWKDFIGIEKYKNVGAFEGGYEYHYGVWRSEENSCMNNNIPYYNVQGRWCIVNRIMQLSGIEYSVQDFIAHDTLEYYLPGTRSMDNFTPLGEPVWIMK